MAFEYGQQVDDNGNIIHEGRWNTGELPKETLRFIIENFRALKDDGIMTVGWSNILSKPTTLSGFGIGDAYTKAQVDSALTGKASLSGAAFTGHVSIETTAPQFVINKTNAPVDSKKWGFISTDTNFILRAIDDANSSNTQIMNVTRSGTTISSVVFPSGKVGISTVPNANNPALLQVVCPSGGYAGMSLIPTGTAVWNGYMFGVEGHYGFFDFNSANANGVRVSSLGPLLFGNNDNAPYRSSTFTERMRLTSAGLLGINTVSPITPLHVARSGNAIPLSLERVDTISANGSVSGIEFQGGNGTDANARVRYGYIIGYAESSTAGSEIGAIGISTYSGGGATTRLWINNITVRPYADNTYHLGTSIYRWANVNSVKGSISNNLSIGPSINENYPLVVSKTSEDANMIMTERLTTINGGTVGNIVFTGGNISSATARIPYAALAGLCNSGTSGSESGSIGFYTKDTSSSLVERATLTPTRFRPSSNNAFILGDASFRWSESHVQNGYFYNIVGIGTNTPYTSGSGLGRMTLNGSEGGSITFTTNNSLTASVSSNASKLLLMTMANLNHPVVFGTNGIERWYVGSGGVFVPSTDNVYSIGASGLRPSQIYAATATINTSDRNAKTDIKDLDLGLDFINSLKPVEFKYKIRQNEVTQVEDGTETVEIEPKRTETRVVTPAQYEIIEVEPAVYETVVTQPEVTDEEGNIVSEAITEEILVKEAVTEERLVSEEVTKEVIIPAKTEERPKYKEVVTPLPGKRTHAGLIAQEVEKSLNGKDIGIFTIGEDGQYGLRYEELIAPLIKAVQELSAKVEQQAGEIESLKNQTA